MGILFNSNSWRRPLRLIDSWLPAPAAGTGLRLGGPALQAFARAGWLRGSARRSTEGAGPGSAAALAPQRSCHVRVAPAGGPEGLQRVEPRVVLSGRMADVCAELDRLAALEQRGRLNH